MSCVGDERSIVGAVDDVVGEREVLCSFICSIDDAEVGVAELITAGDVEARHECCATWVGAAASFAAAGIAEVVAEVGEAARDTVEGDVEVVRLVCIEELGAVRDKDVLVILAAIAAGAAAEEHLYRVRAEDHGIEDEVLTIVAGMGEEEAIFYTWNIVEACRSRNISVLTFCDHGISYHVEDRARNDIVRCSVDDAEDDVVGSLCEIGAIVDAKVGSCWEHEEATLGIRARAEFEVDGIAVA